MIRVPNIISIEQGDPISSRDRNAGVAGPCAICPIRVKVSNSDATRANPLDRIISRSVVNDDDLVRGMGLSRHALERSGNPTSRVIAGDDYRKHGT